MILCYNISSNVTLKDSMTDTKWLFIRKPGRDKKNLTKRLFPAFKSRRMGLAGRDD